MRRVLPLVALALLLSFAGSAAAAPLPDLTVSGPYAQASLHQSTETFLAAGCAVQEGYISEGTHRLLRFATEVPNIGAGDLRLGHPSSNDPLWEYAPCHGHWHFKGFAQYELLDSAGNVVAGGRKWSFCLEDVVPFDLSLPGAPDRPRYNCQHQGISVGWADVYDYGLVGQWIVIDAVPPGDYTLRITVNPLNYIEESDYANDTVTVPVVIA